MTFYEDIGATNYWLDSKGKAKKVGNHLDYAVQLAGLRAPAGNTHINKSYWNNQKQAFQFMYQHGAARIVNVDKQLLVDYEGTLSKSQWKWIQRYAKEHYLTVSDDHGNALADFTGKVSESLVDSVVRNILEGRSKSPDFKTLNKNKVNLTAEERKAVKDGKAEWSDDRSAVFKSVVNGKSWYVTHTHRAFNVRPTVKGAISRFHRFIKSTS